MEKVSACLMQVPSPRKFKNAELKLNFSQNHPNLLMVGSQKN